eukprot:544139_1
MSQINQLSPDDEKNEAPPANATELKEHIHVRFTDRYGADAENIAQKLIDHFTNEDFAWNQIVDDLRCEAMEDCEAMTQIIEKELHFDSQKEKQEAFELYKSCLSPFNITRSIQTNAHLSNTLMALDAKKRLKSKDIESIIHRSIIPNKHIISPTVNPILCGYSDNHIQKAAILLKTFCGPAFKTDYLSGQKDDDSNDNHSLDRAYKVAKGIDVINEKPILLYFVDSYARLRLRMYYNDTKYESWSWGQFFKDHEKEIETKLSNKLDICKQQLQNGLKSFVRRFNMKMRLSRPFSFICDNLNEFAIYQQGFAEYITNIMTTAHLANYVPCHVDIVMIPQCVKGLADADAPSFDPSTSYIDDEDGDDDDEKDTFWYMGYGGATNTANKPRNQINDIGTYLQQSGYVRDKDYIMDEMTYVADGDQDKHKTHTHLFSAMMVKRKLKLMHQSMNATTHSHQRLIFIIDRRNPDVLKGTKKMSYTLIGKNWNDRIYCIRPKHYKNMPKTYRFLPEAMFCMSRQLLLPVNKQMQLQDQRNIGIRDSLYGYLFTTSYHIYSEKTVRAYFGYKTSIQRFYLEDVVKFWPKLFVESNIQINEDTQEFMLQTPRFEDAEFDAFLKIFKK